MSDAGRKVYSQSRLGLFIHYAFYDQTRKYEWGAMGLRKDGTPPESLEELADGFDPEAVAEAAKTMHADYVVFTAWHANMCLLYPSAVMDKKRPGYSSRRDVIRDLIKELQRRGIHLILYIHPQDGHDFTIEDQNSLGWNDTPPYERWNDFVNQITEEIAARYSGEVLGYWVDGGVSPKIEQELGRLRQTIRTADPEAVVIQNEGYEQNYFIRWADYGCRELVAIPYRSEAMQVATYITSSWWSGNCGTLWTPELAFQYAILQAGTFGLEGGGVAYATGPFIGGGWDPGVPHFFKQLGEYVASVAEAFFNTRPSNSFKTMPRTPLLQGGEPLSPTIHPGKQLFVATESINADRCFVHVLSPPQTRTLQLPTPLDGRIFNNAHMLDGTPVSFSQNNNGITIRIDTELGWKGLDTVFVLT